MDWSREKLMSMDAKFVARMNKAIRAGLEKPPMIGVDTRPGTRAPTNYCDHRVIEEKPGAALERRPGQQKGSNCNALQHIDD
jgi:hypothetical protein